MSFVIRSDDVDSEIRQPIHIAKAENEEVAELNPFQWHSLIRLPDNFMAILC